MTYKELLAQLQQLSEEQLNQDLCLYNKWEDQHIQYDVDLVFATEENDVLDLNHPIIRF
jgi:mRNA-degrading endonuclease YafQ of YafQ-DinJ toxin-antitoxin module